MLAKMAVGVSGTCAWGSAVAGGLAWAASVSEVTMELFGVSMPVVLAAIAGSLLARSYVDIGVSYPRAIAESSIWAIVGCFSAPVAVAMAELFGYKALPTSALAFLALLISAMVPRLFPVIAEAVTSVVRTWIGKLKGRDDAAK